MDIRHWLARCAAPLRWRKAGRQTFDNQQLERAVAARSLRTRLSGRLLRDIGLDDG